MSAAPKRTAAPRRAAVATEPPPAFGAYRLEQLGFASCKFACESVGTSHRFCGRPTSVGPGNKHGSWCTEHLAIVFVPWRKSPGVNLRTTAGGAFR